MAKDVFIILIRQEYENANHKYLWDSLIDSFDGEIVLIGIPADYIVSIIRNKRFRIDDHKKGIQKIKEHLYYYRPLSFIRPELMTNVGVRLYTNRMLNYICRQLSIDGEIYCISYEPYWIIGLAGRKKVTTAYYLTDEYRLNTDGTEISKRFTRKDRLATKTANAIFAASSEILNNRKSEYKNGIIMGNGNRTEYVQADQEGMQDVGLIGNIRDWIDKDLLENLIRSNTDLTFGLVGNIEKNMESYIDHILETYGNVTYYGKVKKELVDKCYGRFRVIIVPYLINNKFIYATRPLKIAESICAGTRVVSVPVSGYCENEFLIFATSIKDFSEAIRLSISRGRIDITSSAYKEFKQQNNWETISKKIVKELKDSRNE